MSRFPNIKKSESCTHVLEAVRQECWRMQGVKQIEKDVRELVLRLKFGRPSEPSRAVWANIGPAPRAGPAKQPVLNIRS